METMMADNHIKDILKDVLKHTHGLGIFEMVKITGDLEKTEIQTVDPDKTVIFKGKTVNPVPDFVDATLGLSRMGVLQGYLNYPGFDDEGATVKVVKQERNGEEVPVEVFSKERDVITGEIKMTGELKVQGMDVIIADDIISTGGTMASAIKISKKSGARKVYAVGTHLLLIQDAIFRILNAGVDEIIGTDTIDNPFSVVSMADVIAEAILK